MFAAYIALAVPAIAALMTYVAWHAPSILNRTIAAVSARVDLVEATTAVGDWKHAMLAAIEIVLLGLPSLGLLFFFMVLARAAVRLIWRQRQAASAPVRTAQQRAPAHPGDAGVSFAAAIGHHRELRRRRYQPDHAAATAHRVSVP